MDAAEEPAGVQRALPFGPGFNPFTDAPPAPPAGEVTLDAVDVTTAPEVDAQIE
jgi:hypothetical protein